MYSPDAHFLKRVNQDLLQQIPEEVRPLDYYPSDSIDKQILDIFIQSTILVEEYSPDSPLPQYDLTIKSVRLATASNSIQPFYGEDTNDNLHPVEDKACLLAESLVLQSIVTRDPELPRGILLDEQGEPFALQKTNGVKSAYAWRDATVQTASGTKWIPEDSFIMPFYAANRRFKALANGRTAILVEGSALEDIGFLRFSTSWMPPLLRRKAAIFAAGMDIAESPTAYYAKHTHTFCPYFIARSVMQTVAPEID